ncbi:NAD(P)-dependent oxidoreductase [Paraglaciecola aquimarina]|uniref:NAD(P)-dependent oxidoreductase n=1 Tax=Paraglaciecola aquimarina TaxID=1235557 RepID=A0ABU3SV10_9ALTE|nr:NAD(P)-dependent oxidoreductase [Paraglaciecola aquimarina]MDU0353841.1 NAD(P)-dependent oxidoreductase [Paraglaciecola aquimarina]
MKNTKVGFIGLGLMGAAMVDRLISLGYEVTVLGNRTRTPIDAALAKGAKEAESAKALSQVSDIIMLCMDTSASVESRVYGNEGVISGLSAGKVVIDFGTSLPSSTKAIGAKVNKLGAYYLDGPLGRTPSHAIEGKLNIMASGDETGFGIAKPVLEDLSENLFYLGSLGSGHTIKLINNFFAMTTASAMSEAFVMADKAGVDRQTLYNVMSAGPLHSAMMDFVKSFAIENNPKDLAFSIKNAAKDVGYYTQMAEDLGIDSIMSKSANNTLTQAVEQGYSENMVPELVSFFEKKFK